MRVYEIAKKYKIGTKELIEILKNLGIEGKRTLSIITDEEVKKIEEYFLKKEKVGKKIEEKIEEKKITTLTEKKEEQPRFVPRAPVVTIMGHVDHGKTTILDKIRNSRIAEKEVGQITQKIGAYKVNLPEGSIVFLDTPGHEAFTAMRAMGAKVTDIVVLVVAADEGVKPQTIEALNHARSANVPIIVAINKIDKPNANPEKVKQQLAEYGLIPEEWGGDTIYVNVSGLTGDGIRELLEMILLLGEIKELKANINCKAEGTVIESSIDKFRGPVITVIIENGILKVGDPFVVGNTYGKVRAMIDDWGRKLNEAWPSTPVEILGAHEVVIPGEKFKVVNSEKEAKEIVEKMKSEKLTKVLPVKRLSLQDLYNEIKKGEIKELNIVLKTDFYNSIDAIKNIINKIPQNEIKIDIIHAGTGPISESDVLLASASNGIILGFKVPVEPKAKEIAKKENVEIRNYEIIYDIADDLIKAIEGMLEPEIKEEILGQALVKKIFKLSKNVVAGCIVVDGKVVKNSKVRIIREGKIIFEGFLSSLKRFKENVNEVSYNNECGIGIENFNDFKEGDIIQSYTLLEVPRKLKGV
jgi:translation initiation factor IF-2